MVGVVATIGIICGSDAVLILYGRHGRGWRPLLIRRSPPYRQISGANGDFRYAVSPPDARGRWHVVTSRVPPWCTSAWSTLYYDLSRPGPTPEAPAVFFRRAASLYFGFDDSDRLTAGANRLQVLHDGGIFDAGVLIRRYVETYAVDGDRVRRIAPVAFNARDFVDAWLDMDWREAAAMSAPGLADAHRILNLPRDGTNRYFELGEIHGCGGPDLAPAIQRAEDLRRGINRG